MNQEASDCSNCSLLRSNLSDVMRRLGDHDMLVRMLDLATKQRDLLQKQLSTAVENEANCKRDCTAMQVRSLLSSSCFMIHFFLRNILLSHLISCTSTINVNAPLYVRGFNLLR